MQLIEEVEREHVELLRHARGNEIPVVFTRYGWRTNDVDVDRKMEQVFGREAFRWGGTDVELLDSLKVTAHDTVIDKPRFDSFFGTPLDLILRQQGTRRLLLTGVATNGCVETTARTATQLGYGVFVAADATSAVGSQHEHGLASIAVGFGEVVPWREVLD
jgi:nicotinamidase-related amidase